MLALGQYNYWVVIILMMSGFYTVIARGNLIKQVVGLAIFQTSVFMLYISLANVAGATARRFFMRSRAKPTPTPCPTC